MPKNMAIVCTTIGKGEFLDSYCNEIMREDQVGNVDVLVIPDLKTPDEVYQRCGEMQKRGFNVYCPTLDQQEAFLRKVGFAGLVPFNSDNRRNVGYLMALQKDNQVIISIDDDNFPVDGHFFLQEHSTTGDRRTLRELASTNGWYNVCVDLGIPHVYPRGFPYAERKLYNAVMQSDQTVTVAVNQGLWFGEPDVDAHTWIGHPDLRVSPPVDVEPFFVGPNTWLPINSQNTSVSRAAMKAYYFIPVGGEFCQMDRLGDIFQGYFLETCIKELGDGIRVGTPLVEHRRNSHNHSADMMKEWPGIEMLKDLLPWLRELQLSCSSYEDAYIGLSDELEYAVEGFKWSGATKAYFHRVAFCMRRWVKACKMIG